MEVLLKQILSEIQYLKKNMAAKQDLTELSETMTKEFETVNDKVATEFETVNDKVATELATVNNKLATGLATVNNKLATGFEIVNDKIATELATVYDKIATDFTIVNDKIDQLAAESQKDVIAMIGLIDKKLDKRLDQIETKIDILDHRVAAQDGEIKLLKLAK